MFLRRIVHALLSQLAEIKLQHLDSGFIFEFFHLIYFFQEAGQKHGCQQIMWLYGDDEQVTEAGTMNMFMLWKNKEVSTRNKIP